MSSRLWIKICGLTTTEGVAAAVQARVDAIGFVFAPSKRRIDPQRARELSLEVPAGVARVAVFQHPEQALLDEVCDVVQPDIVQTDIEDLASLHLPHGMRVNPVVRAGAAPPLALPPRIVFEGPVSGIGKSADWSEAAVLARRTQLILAGGLNPSNVATAIRTVQPYGVDVSSGVEASAGIKDPALIMRFVTAVRAAQDAVAV
jgi:phosphoribosylanthranilate isomerase